MLSSEKSALGYTQAFSSLGGLLVGGANVLAARFASELPAILGVHEAWRYTLISGVIPALPLIFIRPFLPESPVWSAKKSAGTLKRPSIRELFSPQLIRTTLLTTLVFAASYGIAFGAIQQLPQILGGPKGHAAILKVAEQAVESAKSQAMVSKKELSPGKIKAIAGNATDEAVATVTIYQEMGGLMGRFLLAVLALAYCESPNIAASFSDSCVVVCAGTFLVDFNVAFQCRLADGDQGRNFCGGFVDGGTI